MKDFIHILFAGAVGALAAYFNVLLIPLAVLVAVMLIDNKAVFEWWRVGMAVNAGKILRYSDNLYRVIQPHTTQADWSPDITPALYNKITATEWEKWEPNNFYAKGAKVTHNNKKWISNVDNNHWEPGAVGVYTWDEYTG